MKHETPIAPVTVSQDTCLAVYGVSPRWYLDRANAGVFRTWRAGKLVLSRPEDFLAYLSTLPGAAAPTEARPSPAEPASSNAVALRFGLKATG